MTKLKYNIIKNIVLISMTISMLFAFSVRARAAELTVIFNANPQTASEVCDLDPEGGALFSSLDVKPGDTLSQTLEIKNDSQDDVLLSIEMINVDEPGFFHHLSDVLELKVIDDATSDVIDVGVGTVGEWKSKKTIVLPKILGSENAKSYTFTVSIDSSVDNDYQEKNLSFDLKFVCENLAEDSEGDVLGDESERDPVESVVQAVEDLGEVLGESVSRLPDTGQTLLALMPAIGLIGVGFFIRRKRDGKMEGLRDGEMEGKDLF